MWSDCRRVWAVGFVYVPLAAVTFRDAVAALRNEGTAIFSLIRNIGSSIGISVVEHAADAQHADHAFALAEHVTPYSAVLRAQLPDGIAQLADLGRAERDRHGQAAMIAYNNDFKLMMVLSLAAIRWSSAAQGRKPKAAAGARRDDSHAMTLRDAVNRRGGDGAALAVSGFSGCAVGPDFTRPAAPQRPATRPIRCKRRKARRRADTAQHIALGERSRATWWTLVPLRCDRSARDSRRWSIIGPSRRQRARSRRPRNSRLAQAGTRYPQVASPPGLAASSTAMSFWAALAELPPFTYFAVGPTVSYTLDYTGGVARSVEQQYALAEVERHQLDAAYLTVTGKPSCSRSRSPQPSRRSPRVETILAQDRDNLRLVQTAFDDGSVSRIDIVSAQSQIANDMTLLPPLRQDLATSSPRAVGGAGPASGNATCLRIRSDANHAAARSCR